MRNLELYHKRMETSLGDKTDYIIEELKTGNYQLVIDYGCANGAVIEHLAKQFPNILFIGYDHNNKVIRRNKQRIKKEKIENVDYYLFLGALIKEHNPKDLHTLVVFSSVLHEIFSETYAPNHWLKELVTHFTNVDTFAIRDMRFRANNNIFTKKDQEKIIKELYPEHYDLEIQENYNAVKWEFLDKLFKILNYKKVLHIDYILPFYKKTFGDTFKYGTHSKRIYVSNSFHG